MTVTQADTAGSGAIGQTAPSRERRSSRRPANTILNLLMIAIGAIWVLPIVWLAILSVRLDGAVGGLSTKYFRQVFTDYGMLPNLINSITVTTVSTVLAVIIGTPAAYGLSRFAFRGNRPAMVGFLFTRMAPPILVALPFFVLSRTLGVYDTVGLLILVYTVINLSWVVFMMRSYFDDIPRAIDEAASVDGASRFRTFQQIVFPLARPGLVATAIFCVVTSWNEYLFAVMLTSVRAMTLPASLTSFLTVHGLLVGPMAAASVTVMAPILALALWMQKHLIRGMAMGAVR